MTIRFTTDELNERVLAVILAENPTLEHRITKEMLAVRIYGYYNPSVDRNIRDSVTELTLQGYPICATSDMSGYYLARTYAEAEQCLAELESRREILKQRKDGIMRGLVNAKQPIKDAVQMELI